MKRNENPKRLSLDPFAFCDAVRNSLRLHAEGLITDKEFHDVTNNDHYRLMGESFAP